MTDFLRGFVQPWLGLGVLLRPGIARLALAPVALNVVLYAAALYGLAVGLDRLIDDFLPAWLSWLEWLLWPLLALLAAVLVLFTFARLCNLLAAPFTARLCRRLLRQRPEHPLAQAAEASGGRHVFGVLGHELLKLALFLPWFLPLAALSLLPLIGPFAALALAGFGIYWNALEYLDYPLSEAGVPLRGLRARLRQQRALLLGFGAGQLLLTLTPVLNLASVPAGAAGATRLCLRHPPPARDG